MSAKGTSASDERAQRVGRAFLAVGALRAARTLNAWQPFSRLGRASVLAFPSGLTLSEMPLHALAWQALGTAGFVAARWPADARRAHRAAALRRRRRRA